MAKQRIFLPNIEATTSNPPTTLLEAFLNRLARSHLLFQHTPHTAPLASILPNSTPSKFHKFFVQFCARNKLPLVLSSYLESYQLARTKAEADVFWQELEPENELGLYDWVKLLFLLRHREGDSLFQGSLLQAKKFFQVCGVGLWYLFLRLFG